MRPVLTALALGTASLSASAATHCLPSEVIYFSCRLEKSQNVASVCGSAVTTTDSPQWPQVIWLQYRFGKIGHPEMTYPTRKADSLKKFSGFWSFSKLGGFAIDQLSFDNKGFTYFITKIESANPDDVKPFVGVEVLKGTTAVSRRPCADQENTALNLREAVLAVPELK